MASSDVAWAFVLSNEDVTPPSGKVTREPDGALARLGLNSHWHQEALGDGFYSMPLGDALVYAKRVFVDDYWAMIDGDLIVSQLIATKVADVAFNGSPHEAILLLQRAVNLMRTANKLAEDGMCGDNTIAAVNTYLDEADETALYGAYLSEGSTFYDELQVRHPEKFSKKLEQEWISRLEKHP